MSFDAVYISASMHLLRLQMPPLTVPENPLLSRSLSARTFANDWRADPAHAVPQRRAPTAVFDLASTREKRAADIAVPGFCASLWLP